MTKSPFYFSDGPYLETMQGVVAALSRSDAAISLIGKSRTGKSTLCEKITQFLQHKDYQVFYFDQVIESPELLQSLLAHELDIPDSASFASLLNDVLMSRASAGDKPLVLIFDDAHQLSDITLIEIHRLVEVQLNKERLLNIVLCGEPELERRLHSGANLKRLSMQVSNKFYLEPMSPETLQDFFALFLEKASMPGLQLEPAAMDYFVKACKGFPGPALALSAAIVSARGASAVITPVGKTELADLARNSSESQALAISLFLEPNKWFVLGPLAAVIMFASLGFIYQLTSGNVQNVAGLDLNNPAMLERARVESPFLSAVETTVADETVEPTSPPQILRLESDEEIAIAATHIPQEPQITNYPEEEIETTVSDSDLALVTAAERGVADADITEPDFANVDDFSDASNENGAKQPNSSLEQDTQTPSEPPPVSASQFSATSSSAGEPGKAGEAVGSIAESPTSADETVRESALESVESAEKTVIDWLSAWESKNLVSYFSRYHDNFIPRYHDSTSAWRQARERVINNAQWIKLQMSGFEIVGEDESSVEVNFRLAYESPTYADTTLKKLLLVDDGGGSWKIIEEVNISVGN